MNLGLTPEQVAERRAGIGGSDAYEVMCGDWRKLWRIKTGRAQEDDLSDNLAVQMGIATEAFNVFWYTKQTGRPVTMRNTRRQSGPYPWMVANLDGLTLTSRGEGAYWDAKHVGQLREDTVLRYTPQMVHCCTILDLEWWVLSVFIGNAKWEIVEQEVDPIYQAQIIAREEEFWRYVERDEEPPEPETSVLAPKPALKLRTVQLEDEWRADWPNWGPSMVELFGTFASTYAAATAHNIARDQIKGILPDDVGLVTRGRIKVARDKAGAVRMSISKKKADDC